MLSIILIESYFLFAQPRNSAPDAANAPSSTSQAPNSSSENETADSQSPTGASTSSQTSTGLSNGTSGADSVSFVPAVPEFTLNYADSSYDVPTTYSTDPFTGKSITNYGYHVERRSIVLSIKNQPIPTPVGPKFTYNIRIKGHFGQEWREMYLASDGYLSPSDSTYTVLEYDLTGLGDNLGFCLSSGGQVDFQVMAMYGFIDKNLTQGPLGSLYFAGKTSGWSPTQTIKIP